jgi:hypothetical protein
MAFFVPNVAQNFAFKTPLPHLRVLSAVFSALSATLELDELTAGDA